MIIAVPSATCQWRGRKLPAAHPIAIFTVGEDELRDPEERGRLKADRGGILTTTEPLHFDLSDLDPPNGRARECREKFPKDESDDELELK